MAVAVKPAVTSDNPPPRFPPVAGSSELPVYLSVDHTQVQADQVVTNSARESLRVYRALVARATDVFGDEIMAARWLSTPNPDFNGEPPLQAAQRAGMSDETIDDLFEPIFVRIEEGIYW